MKRVLNILFCILLVSALTVPALAEGMPDWYIEDASGFVDFHGENLPLVVDDADVLTDEQEEELNARMAEVVGKYNIGYVLFTDDDNHGLTPEEYSSNFLHFGGYGVGDGYGAVVFYLCFDPSDRCWRTTSINSYMSIFTASVTYEIDELVDADIRAGSYYEAFHKHIDFVEKLFANATENLAEWYPEGTNTFEIDRYTRVFENETDLSKPRIVDDSNLFSDSAKKSAEAKLKELSKLYDYDLIVFTDDSCNTVNTSNYADDFYYYNGYGENGGVFYLVDNQIDNALYYGILFEGSCYDDYRDLSYGMLDAVENQIDSDDYDKALENYVKRLEFVLKHKRQPMPMSTKLTCLVIGLIAGLIVGGIHIAICRKGMRVVAPVGAKEYLVKDSFVLRDKKVYYLYSTVTRTAKPKSGSSSGGGGSSYSSGSSSGGSYSSGGRSF